MLMKLLLIFILLGGAGFVTLWVRNLINGEKKISCKSMSVVCITMFSILVLSYIIVHFLNH